MTFIFSAYSVLGKRLWGNAWKQIDGEESFF